MTKEELISMAKDAQIYIPDEDANEILEKVNVIAEMADKLLDMEVCQNKSGGFTSVSADRMREDIPEPSIPREALLESAPESHGGCFVVPKTIE